MFPRQNVEPSRCESTDQKTADAKPVAWVIQQVFDFFENGGWGGIRTHGTVSRTPVFKTGSLNHSDTHPRLPRVYKHLGQRVNCLKSLIYQSLSPDQI